MQRRTRLALSLWLVLLSGFQGSAEPLASKDYVGTYVWRINDDSFGGFSAIEVSEDGMGFVALGDKAMLVTGQFTRDSKGQITGIQAGPIMPLRVANSGKPLQERAADSEGLAIGPKGVAYVSFENRPRVARLNLKNAYVSNLLRHPDFYNMPRNGALEALAIDEQGRLYTLPEEAFGQDTIPVYRWQDKTWDKAFTIPKRGRFLPVAADFGPDGRFYLLERDFRGMGGFASRLRRFDLTPEGFQNESQLFATSFGQHDNLEGLSVWRDIAGFLHATMISDDNFVFFQRTELVEYQLPD